MKIVRISLQIVTHRTLKSIKEFWRNVKIHYVNNPNDCSFFLNVINKLFTDKNFTDKCAR